MQWVFVWKKIFQLFCFFFVIICRRMFARADSCGCMCAAEWLCVCLKMDEKQQKKSKKEKKLLIDVLVPFQKLQIVKIVSLTGNDQRDVMKLHEAKLTEKS